MTGLSQPTPVLPQQIYAQDAAPTDTRDGVQWVDTSQSPPKVFVYSVDSGAWEPAAPSSVKIQDAAPAGPKVGDGWVDTSLAPPRLKIYDGAAWGREVPTSTDTTGQTGGYTQWYSHTNSGDFTFTKALNDVMCDGARFQFDGQTYTNMDVVEVGYHDIDGVKTILDGTTYDSGNYSKSYTFEAEHLQDLYITIDDTTDGGNDSVTVELAAHVVELVTHSHGVTP